MKMWLLTETISRQVKEVGLSVYQYILYRPATPKTAAFFGLIAFKSAIAV